MSRFYGRQDFERACRVAGITELSVCPVSGNYENSDTQKAFLVWDSLAQTRHASSPPPAWLVRRRGWNARLLPTRPFSRATPAELEALAARDIQVLALYPCVPSSSPSADAVLAERQRQIKLKGYEPERDLRYTNAELARAATSYALQALPFCALGVNDAESALELALSVWPWPSVPAKQETRLRALEKAAALLIAEHERLSTQPPE